MKSPHYFFYCNLRNLYNEFLIVVLHIFQNKISQVKKFIESLNLSDKKDDMQRILERLTTEINSRTSDSETTVFMNKVLSTLCTWGLSPPIAGKMKNVHVSHEI